MYGALEVAHRATAFLGEGPTWDHIAARLLWVDILGCEVHHLDVVSGVDTVLRTPQHVGAAKPRAGGGLVVNLRDGVGCYDTDGGFGWLARIGADGRRGNDAAVDSAGHLWAGTMRYDETPGGGRLYRISPAGEVTTVLSDVTISNGTGWSPDGRLMYYVDTPTGRVDVFDVEPHTGLVGRRREFARIDADGYPDGLTVDADGGVWVALWDGGAVHRYTAAGVLDRVITLPVRRPTACAFGGSALRDLYITTATTGLSDEQRAAQPLAGSVFVLPDAGTGQRSHAFAG